ncbi:type 1 periplasmic binding fold superfamily protein [Vicingaceae bacterium]|nr:type 1 periplasmic binding fold superfamily protein [Vicingaceae bacterium]MDB4082682.1 type 1 periplasmic binding fold superfamily protein [Vicingaceae bacterium]
MKTKLIYAFIAISLFACKEDDENEPVTPIIPNEEEVITTVKYTLTPVMGGTAKVFQFKDLDGDGGNAPVITTDSIDDNVTYSGTLEFLNELETPADSITNEVLEEGDEHQVFFQVTAGDYIISYADVDKNGKPLGLSTTFESRTMGGSLTVILRHKPDKAATGVSGGDITNAGGETDIEVVFPINVR